jgi:predicted MPP superfamily phosphohydrolase
MLIFLLTFITVYTAMNVLVYLKAKSLFPHRRGAHHFFLLFVVLMVAAPIGVRSLERVGYEGPATLLAYLGYNWMGFVFLSVWGFLAAWIIGIVLKLFNRFTGTNLPSATGRPGTGLVFAAVLLTCVYGYGEARSVRVERVEIHTGKLPQGMDRLKIAQISDVHLGLINGKDRLQKIVDLIRAEQPDILVATGDVVDGDMAKNGEIHELLKQVQPRFGKFAVTGNHELYAGLAQALETIERSGFTMLRGEAVAAGGLNIVGIDDPTVGSATDEAALLQSSQNGAFTLYLKHRPQVPEETRGLFDLQLSGHTHRGQIFPFRFFTGMAYPMQNGLYDLGKGSMLYTSRGSGTWGPPIRVLSPPEVTIIDLVR